MADIICVIFNVQMNLPEKFHTKSTHKNNQDFMKRKGTHLSGKDIVSYAFKNIFAIFHPLILEFHFKRAISSLNGKLDVQYGPLQALHSECQEFVEYDDCCHEYEDDDAYESECGNVDNDKEDESVSEKIYKQNDKNGVVVTNEPVRGANKNEQIISCRAVPGIHQSKHERLLDNEKIFKRTKNGRLYHFNCFYVFFLVLESSISHIFSLWAAIFFYVFL
ncbi:hypothetical protein RFI_28644 [Reticulomyxa filosa]|uniref:Uncharacterized protein n=1 Tax=Reticulomyxa filosa TaxID=46433 RepID=X6M429_RETFI|nr:hypothetical protein RFI_28644 [Reticulomyxa filosa]|eukprot:ETO08743.1 hypothetical protein RFI_28644 [Reticulomyxa filosa]